MKTISFAPGADFLLLGTPHRVVSHLPGDTVLVENIVTRAVVTLSINEALEHFEAGRLTALEDPQGSKRQRSLDADLSLIPAIYREIALQKRDTVEAAIAVLDGKVTLSRLESNFQHIAKKIPRKGEGFVHSLPTPRQVYEWYRQYVKYDRSVHAFVPRESAKGNRLPRLPEEVSRLIDIVIDDFYLTRTKHTVKSTYKELERRIDKRNDRVPDKAPLVAPSRTALYRRINARDPFDVVERREGRTAAMARFRGGGAGELVREPLERVEIDHNCLDVRVVDASRKVVLGRPWLTVVLDCYTRMVLGYFIRLGVPSVDAVNQALRCAIGSKVGLLKRIGSIKHDWPAFGIMQKVVVDNGLDLHASSFRLACAELGICIDYTPPRSPHYKGTIERFFRTMNDGLVHEFPGTTRSNPKDRGEESQVNRPAMTLGEVEAEFVRWVVDDYHYQFHSSINQRPIDRWAGDK